MSWLNALSRHPVWTLPPPSADRGADAANPATASRTTSNRPRTAAGELGSSISHSASSQSLFGSVARAQQPSPRLGRSTSSASNAPAAASPRKRTQPQANGFGAAERRVRGARTSSVAVVRGADLVVAVGSELRIASLAQVKANVGSEGQTEEIETRDLGEYKVLHTPTITFEIQQLVLNPTSKLLAVVGAHSVVVVVLPRRGWSNAVGKTIECRCLPVGAFYHSLPGSPAIASALWHPLGADASSLCLLTTDCTLREYTISEDVSEPAQTLSFARSPAGHGKKGKAAAGFGFSAIDRDEQTAAAMCVGQGDADWGPLTLYALMRNGDIVSLCPFLPRKAAIPPSYVHALSAFVSTKVDYLSSSLTGSLNTTVKHSSIGPVSENANRLEALETRYNLQLAYVQSLSRQLASASAADKTRAIRQADTGGLSDSTSADGTSSSGRDGGEDAPVRVTAPSRPNLAAVPQGPFLLQPAPAELDNGADDRAVDLAYLSSASMDRDEADPTRSTGGLGVLLVAFRDGKVDVCLEVEKPEARFVGEEEAARSRSAGSPSKGAVVLRRKGFGLAELEDDEDDVDAQDANADAALVDLPTLAVYESIDLGLAAELNPNDDDEDAVRVGLKHNAPRLVRDPLYPDTVYIQHVLGAHCLLLGPWLAELSRAMGAPNAETATQKALQSAKGTEVLWVLRTRPEAAKEQKAVSAPAVEGLVVLNDVYLGYSLLLVTQELQMVGIELSLRVDPSAVEGDSAQEAASAEAPAYVSLLEKPFSLPPLLANRPPGAPPVLPRLPLSKKPLEINPELLRGFAKHVSTAQTAIQDLVSAADAVQSRLELQMRELSRQVDKLAELERMRDDLGKSVSGGTEGRLRRAEAKQRELLARTDRVLQRLVESHQPSVSTYERKWFDELERLEEQVVGRREDSDGDDAGGAEEAQASCLEMRARRVEAMFETLRPDLEGLRRKREDSKSRSLNGTPARNQTPGLGQNQVKVLEERLADEARLLAETKRKVETLAGSLASTSLAA